MANREASVTDAPTRWDTSTVTAPEGWDETVLVHVGHVTVRVPIVLLRREERAFDSTAAVFEGAGQRVIVDEGPFADPLQSRTGTASFHERVERIGGTRARVVSFDDAQGSHTVAAHLQAPRCTITAVGDPQVPHVVLKQIISSIEIAE